MKKVLDTMQKIQILCGALFLLIFFITVLIQMFTRYLGISATWTEDVSMYSFIWAVFMGAGAMVYENKHFAFTSLYDAMKNEKAKKIISIIIAVMIFIFSALMVYYGILIAQRYWTYTWTNIPSLKRGPVWLCLPVSGLTACVYTCNSIVQNVIGLVKGE